MPKILSAVTKSLWLCSDSTGIVSSVLQPNKSSSTLTGTVNSQLSKPITASHTQETQESSTKEQDNPTLADLKTDIERLRAKIGASNAQLESTDKEAIKSEKFLDHEAD